MCALRVLLHFLNISKSIFSREEISALLVHCSLTHKVTVQQLAYDLGLHALSG